MKETVPSNQSQAFEDALAQAEGKHYLLRLYVTGSTPRSVRAIQNIRDICERNLQGRYELEVIDIYQHPEKAASEQIVVIPTLIKSLPLPFRKIIGDLSDKERVLVGLNLLADGAPIIPSETRRGA
jgi:circadian clock protein KaiB